MIYRVTIKRTNSLQPGRDDNSYWLSEVVYCGNDLEKARIEYLKAPNYEHFYGFGNSACRVIIEQFESDPEDIEDLTCNKVFS